MGRPCGSCGATVPDGEAFCDNCGMPVGSQATTPVQPVEERRPPAASTPGRTPVDSLPAPPEAPTAPFRDPRTDVAASSAAPALPVPPVPAAGGDQAATPAGGAGRFVGLASLGVLLLLLLGTGGWLLLSGRDDAPEVLQAPARGGGEPGPAAEQEPQEPTGEETTGAPEPEPADGPASGTDYATVREGALAMEVPKDWTVATGTASEGSGTSWSQVLGTAEVSVTAAPDLEAWHDSGTATGVYAVASRALAGYTNEQITTTGPNDVSGPCTRDDAQDFSKDDYSARVQPWTDCGDDPEAKVYTVAVAPAAGGCAVALRIGTPAEGGLETAQHIMDTLAVDCASLPPAVEATPPEVPAEDAAPQEEGATGGYTPPAGASTGGYVPPEGTTAPYPPPEGTTPQ